MHTSRSASVFLAVGLLGCGTGDGPVGVRADARPDVVTDAEPVAADVAPEDASAPDAVPESDLPAVPDVALPDAGG